MATADTWGKIHNYGHLGTTTFLNANPGIGTQTLEQGQADYPQQTVFGRALARRRAGAGSSSTGGGTGTPTVQRGDATGPLRTPEPRPFEADRRAVGPEPDRLKTPQDESFTRNLSRQLKAIDNRAAVIPTPGDLGPWFLALAFLLFAIVPFNGYTRVQLIWLALTGGAHVPDFFDAFGDWVKHVAGDTGTGSSGAGGGSGSSNTGGGGRIAQGNNPGTMPPPPKQEAPGGFTPRSIGGAGL